MRFSLLTSFNSFVVIVLVACHTCAILAAEGDAANSTKALVERTVTTEHDVTIAGHEIGYTATAGTMVLNESGMPAASVFYIAYTMHHVPDPSHRAITFAFNGGPGSSSAWLHLGFLGPRRVQLDASGRSTGPPYRLQDNPDSLLDVTDLVFIDPVSTGYSRAATAQDAKQFHGYEGDIHSVGDFIRLYLTKNERWLSPKFLIGESYGATRAAGLTAYLQDDHRIYLSGVLLISPALNFQTIQFDEGNDLPYILFLPTYTATAWFHKRLDDDLREDLGKAVAASVKFAEGEYASALLQGDTLSTDQRNRVAQQVSRFSGLRVDYVRQSNLRVGAPRFAKQLLRDERQTIGRFDSRFTGVDLDAVSGTSEYDPSGAELFGTFGASINDYLRRELNFEDDQPYEVLSSRVQPWDFDHFTNRYVDASVALQRAMTTNPRLHVFVASGYYDLATPLLATDYVIDHLHIDSSLRKQVTRRQYEAGHMMYIKQSVAHVMKQDVACFYESTLGNQSQ